MRWEEGMEDPGLKAMASTKAPKFGTFIVEFATPGIGHILKSAGCEFVLFDLEHSGFGFETVKSAIRYFEAAALPAIVRVPSREYHHIARAMDMGAEGLMLPMVGNVDEVLTRYPGRPFIIEMKGDDPALGPAVVEVVRGANAASRVCLGSCSSDVLAAAEELAAGARA